MFKNITCYLLFLGLTTSISAQNLGNPVLTLEEAIGIAIQKNYNIQLYKNDINIAQTNNTKAYAGLLPKITASAGEVINNNSLKQKLTNGTEINRNFFFGNNLNAGLNVNWMLYDGGKSKTMKNRLEETLLGTELNLKTQIINTNAAVATAYYEIARQQKQLKSIDDLIVTSQERLRIAENKFIIGTNSKMDFLQSTIDLNVLKSNRLRQITNIQQAKVNLNLLLSRPADTPFEINDDILLNFEPNLADLRSKANTQNMQLKVMEQNIKIAELIVQENAALRKPYLGFGGAVSTNFAQSQAGFSLFNLTYGLGAGLTASVPIWDGGSLKRLEEVAQLDVTSKKIQVEQQKTLIDQTLNRALNEYNLAVEMINLEKDNQKIAQENITIAIERFRLNQSSNSLELKEAQRSLEDAQTRLINATFNAKIAEIELKRLIGDL